ILDLLDQDDVLAPGELRNGQGESGLGDLSHKLWDDLLGSLVGEEQGPHAVDVGPREPALAGEGLLEVVAQVSDHGMAPAAGLLFLDDGPADVPVELDEFAVGGEGGAKAGGADALLELSEELLISLREQVAGPDDLAFRLGPRAALLGHQIPPWSGLHPVHPPRHSRMGAGRQVTAVLGDVGSVAPGVGVIKRHECGWVMRPGRWPPGVGHGPARAAHSLEMILAKHNGHYRP